MNFEEFFKKKRIDLAALEKAEPALFSEFKIHFEQMGEKSFDHTKKYWFNKTRRQFPLAVEVKTERVHIANPLAEQTITESLTETETAAPKPKTGFTPRFKAAGMPKPAESASDDNNEALPSPAADKQAVEPTTESTEEKPAAPQPKVGFTPRFKAGNMPKPAENAADKKEETNIPAAEKPAESTEAKPAYQPRFKMKPKVEENTEETKAQEPAPEKPSEAEPVNPPEENGAAKPTYKPRFNIKNIPPKSTEE